MTGNDVLLLGLGLGSIPYMLEVNFKKIYDYTAVELDEDVIYLAHKYSMGELESKMEYVCTDALLYVLQCKRSFDMICMDIFLDARIPDKFLSRDFLSGLKKLLAPNGILLFNCLASNKAEISETKFFFENTFKPVFPDGRYLDVHKNWILTNKKN